MALHKAIAIIISIAMFFFKNNSKIGTNISMGLFKLWLTYVIEYHIAIPMDDK